MPTWRAAPTLPTSDGKPHLEQIRLGQLRLGDASASAMRRSRPRRLPVRETPWEARARVIKAWEEDGELASHARVPQAAHPQAVHPAYMVLSTGSMTNGAIARRPAPLLATEDALPEGRPGTQLAFKGTVPPWRQAPKLPRERIVSELPPDQTIKEREGLRIAFLRADPSIKGTVSRFQLRGLLRSGGLSPDLDPNPGPTKQGALTRRE